MLKQFNVYRNHSTATNKELPYYMIIQHDYYDDLPTRLIMPLGRRHNIPRWHQHLLPRINVEFDSLLIYAPMMTNLTNEKIDSQEFVCNVRLARQDVLAAIDALITNT
ncbi:CcdB family protein [Enterobacteriaceae bacterium H4N4]|uniref:Toxin CcdB n=1 Tax=Silvania confinis TaxID=2926470 RepID=A0A9J6QQE8_9ENTR|nr:CcdB family protein [Silvania confinis]MCU6671602.1 CcdB family protein [Silvania confinis]